MAKLRLALLQGVGAASEIERRQPVVLLGARWKSWLCAAVCIGLASCSAKPSAAPPERSGPASASDEVGESHDQSAFAKDPTETHITSPDELDLHPDSQPAPPKPNVNPGQNSTR